MLANTKYELEVQINNSLALISTSSTVVNVSCSNSAGIQVFISGGMSVTVSAVPLTINSFAGSAAYDPTLASGSQPSIRSVSGTSSFTTLTINGLTPDNQTITICTGTDAYTLRASGEGADSGTNLSININGVLNVDSSSTKLTLGSTKDNGIIGEPGVDFTDDDADFGIVNIVPPFTFVLTDYNTKPGPHFETINWLLNFSSGDSASDSTSVDFTVGSDGDEGG